jgi:putative MATE family efflux protein
MRSETDTDNDALDGEIVPTFYKYMIPSVAGLIAMTSASLVDGFFIGNYVGVTALAAVNLIIPITTLLFGFASMLAIGGSVRGGKYLGEGNVAAASAIFSKTSMSIAVYGVIVISLGLALEDQLFATLGAPEELFPVMSEYYRIILPFLFAEFVVVALYFFIRLDGFPRLAAAALAIGAAVNFALDYLFIGIFGWGLAGAAFATGLSQLLPMLVMMIYFLMPGRSLHFRFRQENWKELYQAAYNGISEFISEASGGIIAFIFNWMMIQRAGVNGVAAITVVNYAMLLGFMIFFAISDTLQVMVSQNFGARNAERISAFLKVAGNAIAMLSVVFIAILLTAGEPIILLFVDEHNGTELAAMATELIAYVWPIFLFAGTTMLISGYLTAIHRPFQSGLVALCHALLFPAILLVLFYNLMADHLFVVALPIAEGAAFVLALVLFFRYLPERAVSE